jgi:hypothetical protein
MEMRNSIDQAALNWLLETTALRSCARGIPIGRLSVSAILGLAAAGGVMAPKPASAQFACASDVDHGGHLVVVQLDLSQQWRRKYL